MAMIERELKNGCHINPERKILNGLGTSHFHTAKSIKEELECGGFSRTEARGVMDGVRLAPNLEELLEDESSKKALMATVRLIETHKEAIGLSGLLLATPIKE